MFLFKNHHYHHSHLRQLKMSSYTTAHYINSIINVKYDLNLNIYIFLPWSNQMLFKQKATKFQHITSWRPCKSTRVLLQSLDNKIISKQTKTMSIRFKPFLLVNTNTKKGSMVIHEDRKRRLFNSELGFKKVRLVDC